MNEPAVLAEVEDLLLRSWEAGSFERARLRRLLRGSSAAREAVEAEIEVRRLLATAPPPAEGGDSELCVEGELLEAYVRRTLDGEARQAVFEHLAECAECRWIACMMLDDEGQLQLPEWVARTLAEVAEAPTLLRRPRTWAVTAVAAAAAAAQLWTRAPQSPRTAPPGGERSIAAHVESSPAATLPPSEPAPSEKGEVAAPEGAVVRHGRRAAPAETPRTPLRPRVLPPRDRALALTGEPTVELPLGPPPTDPSRTRVLPPVEGTVLGGAERSSVDDAPSHGESEERP